MKFSVNKRAVFAFLVMYSFCEPLYLKRIYVFHIAALGIRTAMLAYCLLYNTINKKKIRYIYTFMIAIPICYMIGNKLAGDGLNTAGKLLIYLIAQSVFLTYTFSHKRNELGMYLSGLSLYMQLICIINTISIFLQFPGISADKCFLMDGDNGCIPIYLLALMITYVEKTYFIKRKINQFWIVFISLLIFVVHRQVGAGCVAVAIIIVGWIINYYNKKKLCFSLALLTGMCVILWIAILATSISSFENVINKVLFGKYDSISSRVALWMVFINGLKGSIWFGRGMPTVEVIAAGDLSGWIKEHNTHNIFLEILYNGGIVAFLFFMGLLISVSIHFDRFKKTEKSNMIALIIFAYFIRGLVERGIYQTIFLLSFAFYIETFESNWLKDYL